MKIKHYASDKFKWLIGQFGLESSDNPWRKYPEYHPDRPKKRYLTMVQNTEEVVVEWEDGEWAFKMPVSHWKELPPGP